MAKLAGGRESGRYVRGIIGGRVLLLVTGVTESAIQRVIVVDVAIGAGARGHQMRSGQLEPGAGVVEGAIGPLHGVMAGLACRRECHCDVVNGRGCVGVVPLMARVAGSAREVVVVISVAFGTLTGRDCVRPGQRKAGAVVVEDGVQPRGGVVALRAALREVRSHMVRIGRSLKIFQVATDAGSSAQVVIIVDVAIGTLPGRNSMHSGQREIRRVVVKRSVRP